MGLAHLWSAYLVYAVDVLLIGYVAYRLTRFIRGTHAAPVALGLGILLLATIAIRGLHLPMTGWLLRNFWMSAVVILVVVFQPEIRTALAHLGKRPLGRLLSPGELGFIEEVLGAVQEASLRQLGLLIVLEQEVGLRNYAEGGTIINGEVSKELVLAIFHTRSPLHDGAAIIQNARLVAAGCLLPLSNDPTLAKILGTRHRAAVGLSEFTDALVIVVSEETGAISLAREGRLQQNLKIEDLRRMLEEIYETRARRQLRRTP